MKSTNRTWHKWTKEEEQYLRDNFDNYTCDEFAIHFGVTAASVKRKRTDLKIVKSKEALAKIYARPNAGHFKKGALPHNTSQDQHISTRIDNRGISYKWIRLGLSNWQMLHVYLWLKEGNTIPAGHVVVFKDGNTDNCVLSNLELLSKGENLRRNRNKYLQNTQARREERKLTNKNIKQELRVKAKLEKLQNKLAIKQSIKLEKQVKKILEKQAKKQRKKQVKKIIPIKIKKVPAVIKPPKKEEKKFAYKSVDYNNLILVRIDAKTSIYVKPGENVEAARIKYLNTYKKAL